MAKLWDHGRWRVDADWLERGVAWEPMAVLLLSEYRAHIRMSEQASG